MSLRNENTQANQTEFVDQIQYFENQPTKLFNLKDLKKNKSLRPFYILLALFFLILAILILSVFARKQPEQEKNTNTVKEDVKLDPLSQRAYELRENLKDHDPTKQSLPFPEVDLEFNIN